MAFELRRSHCILIEIKLYNSSLRQHYVAILTDLASPELAARSKTAWTSVNVLGGAGALWRRKLFGLRRHLR